MNTPPVRIGIVGTTWYAETHLKNIAAHDGAVLSAVTGRDQEKAREVAARYGAAEVYADYRDMIASGNIDAIVIVAPDELHAPIALAAFDAGVHVLCEKPLASTSTEAEAMYRAAEASGLQHMSFFALRTSPHHRYLKELIDDGYLGRVYSAEFSLTHGFFRSGDYQWRFDARRGTGALGDLGCYVFDLARWYIGEISAISASTQSNVDRPAPDGEEYPSANDTAVASLEFTNGALATMLVSVTAHQADRLQTNTIRLHGEGGTLELDHTFAGAALRGARAGETSFSELPLPSHLAGEAGDPAAAPARPVGDGAFVDAIRGLSPLEPSFFDGWRVQQVIEAALASAETKSWTTIEEARR